MESMKYCLRAEIDKFEALVGREEERMAQLTAKARDQLSVGNKKTARALLEERVHREKKAANIVTRKNVL